MSELPPKVSRAIKAGPEQCTISVTLKVVTPIFGGAAAARSIDNVDVIRVPTVRGHLRFWWRALHGHEAWFDSPAKLFASESELWGRATKEGDEDGGTSCGRSQVDVRVAIVARDDDHDTSDPLRAPGAYALWPARAQGGGPSGHLPRRKPGATTFTLKLIGPRDREGELRDVVRAWILFGGYGSRTRRGLGSLTVVGDAGGWLPAAANGQALAALFGRDVLADPGKPATQTPWLAGAALLVGAQSGALPAWTTALDQWLREFRQGADSKARQSGAGKAQPNRPSTSNWPEAEMLRRIGIAKGGGPYDHGPEPGYGPARAWPRAGFGLPIGGQFQRKGRKDNGYREPDNFELRWHDGARQRDRLASTLIVKALPLAGGQFVPCALWLNRAYPSGQVVLKGSSPASTGAAFDARYGVPAGTPSFIRDAGTRPLRDAFLDWLRGRPNVTVVAR